MREPIYGCDYKACAGCGDDLPLSAFIDKRNYEQDYCTACRANCKHCGEWVGVCGGECQKEAA